MRLSCDVMNQNFGHQDQGNLLVCTWCGHAYDPKEVSMWKQMLVLAFTRFMITASNLVL